MGQDQNSEVRRAHAVETRRRGRFEPSSQRRLGCTRRTPCGVSVVLSESTMALDPFRPVLAAAAAVLVTAAITHADSLDNQFLGMLSNDGVNVGPPDQMIGFAHQRCANGGLSRYGWFNPHFGGQQSPFEAAMSNLYGELESRGLTTPQVDQFMRDAITVYCPDQTHW